MIGSQNRSYRKNLDGIRKPYDSGMIRSPSGSYRSDNSGVKEVVEEAVKKIVKEIE